MLNADETAMIERAEAWLQKPAGRSALIATGKLLEAVEREKTAESAEAVTACQEAALSALSDYRVATSASGLLLRRVVGFALDKPHATDAEVQRVISEILSSPDATSKAQQRRVRVMFMRAVIDNGVLPEKITRSTAWAQFLAASGRFSHLGGVWARVKTAGVKPETGGLETAKSGIVDRTGYTAGAEGALVTHRLTKPILNRALALWRDMRHHWRSGHLPNVTADTIRKWCGSKEEPLRLGERFSLAYDEGVADLGAKTVNPSRLLPR
jgi:hypothetical protein